MWIPAQGSPKGVPVFPRYGRSVWNHATLRPRYAADGRRVGAFAPQNASQDTQFLQLSTPAHPPAQTLTHPPTSGMCPRPLTAPINKMMISGHLGPRLDSPPPPSHHPSFPPRPGLYQTPLSHPTPTHHPPPPHLPKPPQPQGLSSHVWNA